MSLLRVTLLADPRYVDDARARLGGQKGFLADVRARAGRLGLGPVIVEMQDPTDPRIVTLLTRGRPNGSGDGAVQILRAETIAEPPGGIERADMASHPFDPGLSVADVRMIRNALANEHNPRHLWGIASCLAPTFPVAASLLRARKIAVESNHPPQVVDAPKPDPATAVRLKRVVEQEAASRGIPRDVADEDVRHAAFLVAVGDVEADMPASLRAAGAALVRRVAVGVAIVDRDALLAACPLDGREGFVSPSAIMLALSSYKPEMARVRSSASAGKRGDMLKNPPRDADVGDVLQGRMAMIRAQKAIEGCRWIQWYERRKATASTC